ncbi:hypothetical protein OSB04_021378 [Centaurea solstitialis]|uniref:CCHC-type domain-containing protein n=1 Tax=Centaurea solstitialis TaxID=347529 RepID=A0AA38SU29_9ASTR|nr:hypothetical protein OSB04_021378 [Centaurea solstitialis]
MGSREHKRNTGVLWTVERMDTWRDEIEGRVVALCLIWNLAENVERSVPCHRFDNKSNLEKRINSCISILICPNSAFLSNCKETVKICFHCYQPGHIKPNCPQLNGAPVQAPAPATLRITDGTTTGKSGPITRGQAFQMTAEEAQAALDVITGITLPALVLFDTRAIWSYVSHKFCKDFQIELGKLDRPVTIDVHVVKRGYRGCTIDIFGGAVQHQSHARPMNGINVVVEIDWMFPNRATTDVASQLVWIQNPSGGELTVYGKGRRMHTLFCSVAKAWKYFQRGGSGFLAYAMVDQTEERKLTVAEVAVISGPE